MIAAANLRFEGNRILEIAGPDVLTYQEIMDIYGKFIGKKPIVIPVPVLTPKLCGCTRSTRASSAANTRPARPARRCSGCCSSSARMAILEHDAADARRGREADHRSRSSVSR
jgi:hypothetical protein